MKIGIFGLGGVGGYFGGKLAAAAQTAGNEIYFIARGKHLEAVRENGLLLKTKEEGEFRCVPAAATDDPATLPELDLCILCVKQYALEDAVRALLPAIGDDTVLMPLQNGIDACEKIRRVTDRGVVFPACVYIVTHISAPGVVEQSGGLCTIVFGKDPARPDFSADGVIGAFETAGIKFKYSDDAQAAIWSKFLFMSPMSLVMAAEDLTYGRVYESESASALVRGIIAEEYEVCRAMGVQLPQEEKEIAFGKAKNFPYDGKASFQLDFADPAKQDERETFGLSVLRLGEKYGIEMPVTSSVYAKLEEKGRKGI